MGGPACTCVMMYVFPDVEDFNMNVFVLDEMGIDSSGLKSQIS